MSKETTKIINKILFNKTNCGFLSAILAAILFAFCTPFAKLLSGNVSPLIMGGLLYLGAGVGLFISIIFKKGGEKLKLSKKEIPFIIAMIVLDIAAILFLMVGISKTTSANASLLGNFELVSTSLAAFLVFKEKVSKKLFSAIFLITLASIILTFEKGNSFIFNLGSFLVLLSCVCWGFENNCTKKLSTKDTRKITAIKGIFSGIGGLTIALLCNETFPEIKWILLTLFLGFISYGISVCLYIYSQRYLGASKTGAIYSISPYFGVLFSLIFVGERPLAQFYIALFIMIISTIIIIHDTKFTCKDNN